MKTKKLKTYVITLSKTFMKGHPRAGQPTNFREKFLKGEKIHTIRGNYELWAKRIKEVEEGKAILSVRDWSEKAYRSPQVIIKDLTKEDKIGCQKLTFEDGKFEAQFVDGNYCYTVLDTPAKNDGLSFEDFKAWFKNYKLNESMAIIQFTGFRY